MNILYLNRFRGEKLFGIELWMLRSGKALQDRGHRVFVLARPGSALERRRGEFGLDSPPPCSDAGALREFLTRERIDVICVKSYRDLRLAARARGRRPIRLFIRRGAMGDIALCLRDFFHTGCLRPDILVPSQSLKEEFVRVPWIEPGRIHVLHHGIDPGPSPSPARRNGLDMRVVFAGRLHPLKGLDVLLHAWRTVRERLPSARLTLFGEGEHAAYQTLVAELGLEDSVRFAGYTRSLRPHLLDADLLVLPSRNEGAGYVLLEAMDAGLPVVASDLPTIREYVEDGVTGLLTPPEDAGALADRILSLLLDPGRRLTMGDAGNQRVRDSFTFEASMKKLEALWSAA